eukprot:jgi/Ulvmu1/4045/UM019_0022.1
MLRQLAGVVSVGAGTWGAGYAYCDDKDNASAFKNGMINPEELERAAKAVREIDRSPNAKLVYEQLRQQELSKQADSKKDEASAMSKAREYELATEQKRQEEESKREQMRAQSQQQLMQQQAQLEERRVQQQADVQRQTNAEYLESQKRVSLEVEERKLQLTRQMEAEKKASMQYEAELQKEVAKEKAMAEGRARALEHRENRDIFMEEIGAKAREWGKQYLLLLQEAFQNLGTGAQLLLTTEYGPQALTGAAGLFAAYYGIRGGFGLGFRQLERFLTTPPLVRETSRYNVLQQARQRLGLGGSTPVAKDEALAKADKTFSDIILAPEVKHSVRALAASAANTRLHGAPFRHYLLYGPPGTGKTLLAKRLAHTSGLEYAIMSGGDVAPLGGDAVKQIHGTFDWARRSSRGMVLFVDEADAFLSHRRDSQGEALRSAINAMLYRTGDQSRDYMVILATNRPEDLDPAVLDRVDEQLEVALPTVDLREQIVQLYFTRYLTNSDQAVASLGMMTRMRRMFGGSKADKIDVSGVDQVKLVKEAAQKTAGFSGRELAKLMASVQAAVYGTPDAKLTDSIFRMVLDMKLKQHTMRAKMEANREAVIAY